MHPAVRSCEGIALASSFSSSSSCATEELDDSALVDNASVSTQSLHTVPSVPDLRAGDKADHRTHQPCHYATGSAPTGSSHRVAATAGEIIEILRAWRDWVTTGRTQTIPELADPDCELIERYLPRAELHTVVRRLGLETSITFGSVRDHEPLNCEDLDPEDRSLGDFVNDKCRWEYTASEQFRVRMATSLHDELVWSVLDLLHKRLAAAAARLRAIGARNDHVSDPAFKDLPLFQQIVKPPLTLKKVPTSPGSEEYCRVKCEPDGAIRFDPKQKPAPPNRDFLFLLEIGFTSPRPDYECKKFISYGRANAVLVVDIPKMTIDERLQVSNSASIPVTIKLFRLVKAGNKTDTAIIRPELVREETDTPIRAHPSRAGVQVGLRLDDLYPWLSSDLPDEAQVDLTLGDIWNCVGPAWDVQREEDEAAKIDEEEDERRVVQRGGELLSVGSPRQEEATTEAGGRDDSNREGEVSSEGDASIAKRLRSATGPSIGLGGSIGGHAIEVEGAASNSEEGEVSPE